eukprot:TRINITY_DN21710_c0_g1_i1.p3 TRINITY_DN21710_c0_g1~~TRINITY_DN21710_c0_g1_i1.p3  ORF type:complete len:110 (+),score=11.89 TRINITY_DN21710_c0_g1_i1:383-712(+)
MTLAMMTSFRYRQSAPQLYRLFQPEFRGRLTVRSGRIFCHGHRALLGDRLFLDAVAGAEEGAAVTVVDIEIGWPTELRRDDTAASQCGHGPPPGLTAARIPHRDHPLVI